MHDRTVRVAPEDARDREPDGARAWHAMEAADALAALGATASGLGADDALRRLREHGPNRLPEHRGEGALARFLRQFRNVLIYVLIASATASLLLGHPVDAAVIFVVVLANAAIGFVQEGRAAAALEGIRAMIDPKASVLRDGRRCTVAAEDVVVGDVVLVEAGDRVPADLRLLRCRTFRIDEAALTGESVPAEKDARPVSPDAPLGDRASMAYSGCLVASGTASGVVVATGGATELGRISRMLGSVRPPVTPLVAQMDRFAQQLTFVVLAASAAVFAFAVLVRSYEAVEAFLAVVGIAVAAIPEGLPAVLSITLAIGVRRMASRNAILRSLPAVETLGSVSVICSDKTGTLTRNEMVAGSVVTGAGTFSVSGSGYRPTGAIAREGGEEVEPASDPALAMLVRAAVLCNDAELREAGGQWLVAGDPMEGALVALGGRAGVDAASLRRQVPRTDEIPFDSQHRFMASLHHDHEGNGFVFVKGAPERILAMCGSEAGASGPVPLDAAAWSARSDALAARGQRVLAFARRGVAPEQRSLSFADVERGLELLGLVGLIDPPREEAVQAVADCHAAGIRVVMITGDHAETAREIGRQLGLAKEPVVLVGAEVERLDETGLAEAVLRTDVFARTTPEHKLRLVRALQAHGLTVAMTGDGVNDAPALKRADVGVAMGVKGTEASKQAAQMVLADDNFASIVAAVREGRTVYDNLRKVIAWTLPTNGGEAMTIVAAIALGWTLPMTAVQILWVNMVTAVALGLTLAFEPAEPGSMQRPPRPRGTSLLAGELLWRVGFVTALFVVGCFGMMLWAERRGLSTEYARTLVVNTLVVMESAYLFSVRYVHGPSITREGVLGTKAVLLGVAVTVVAQLAFTYLPFFHAVFETRPLALGDGIAVIGVGALLLLAVEAEKRLRRG